MPDAPPTTASSASQLPANLPASIDRFAREGVALIHQAVQPNNIVENVKELVKTEQWNSFDRFHDTTRTLVAAYEEAGAAVEVYTARTGGRMGTGRWVIPEATDLREATVDIIAPIERRIIDYSQNPWQAIMWGNSTPDEGIVGDLVVMDREDALTRLPDNWLAGKIVLSRLDPREYRAKFYDKGAVAIIFDPIVADCPDATAWVRFGWASPPLKDMAARPIGFVLSVTEGDALRTLVLQHGKLTLRIKADLRRYSGSHDVVSGIVRGQDDAQAEVWAFAHSCEPGALDNASGLATCVEIARVLNELIDSGKLPRPKRSIRLLHGFECYGFFHYYEHHPRFQRPLAGVVIDIVGATPERCAKRLRWHATVPSSAGFVNEVGEVLIQAAMHLDDAGYVYQRRPFLCTEDTLIGDPKYGFPCPWITNHPIQAYHSSGDTPEHLHSPGLQTMTAAMAAYLYYLADVGTDEAMELADWETHNTVDRLKALAGTAANIGPQRQFLKIQHDASMENLQRYVWSGERSQILRHFSDCGGRIDGAIRELAGNAAGVVESSGDAAPLPPVAVAPPPDTPPEVLSEEMIRTLRMIPRRRALLAPTPENIFPPTDEAVGALMKWGHYWADGERSLAEVGNLIRLEWKRAVSWSRVFNFFTALQKLGFIDLIDPADMIDEEQLAADFRSLGIEPGMDLMVHSSLSKIGPVRGGGPAVVRALLKILGPTGTLLAPSFNFGKAKVYNPLTTPTVNGGIADAAWRHPDALRSNHPTHAVAAIGPKAKHYVTDHLENGIWAADSPIGRLVHGGGYILALGTTHHTTTAFHIAEISLNAGCLDQFGNVAHVVAPAGQVKQVPSLAWREVNCPIDDRLLDGALDAIGVQKHGKVGRADCSLVRAIEVWNMRREHLQGSCEQCPVQPIRKKA